MSLSFLYFSFLFYISVSFLLSLDKGLLIVFVSFRKSTYSSCIWALGWHARPLCAWAMCLEVLLSNDHSGMKDSKPLSFPAGRLRRDGSGLPVELVLGLGDCEEPRGRWGVFGAHRLCDEEDFWLQEWEGQSPLDSSISLGRDRGHHRTSFQPRYHIRDRDLKKIHKAASVGNVAKVKQVLLLGRNGLNDRDKKNR